MGDKKQKGGVPVGVVDMTRTVNITLPTPRTTYAKPRPGSGTTKAKNKGGYIKRKKGGFARKG